MVLHGRAAEQAEIGTLLAAARSASGTAMVVRGDIGMGKSALLEQAVRSAGDLRVLVIRGVPAEAHVPYAALHRLLRPVLGGVESLDAPHAAALRGAFGLTGSMVPDRRVVGIATLMLLAQLGAHQPLLCVVDDAHSLDRQSADTLLFVARRLHDEHVGMIFAADPLGAGHDQVLSGHGLPELLLRALDQDASYQLLADQWGEVNPYTCRRVVDEAAGNPLALTELAGALTSRQLAGQLPPVVLGLGSLNVRASSYALFTARINQLPESTRVLLQVVAVDGRGELTKVVGAATRLSAGVDDVAAAERDRLVRVDGDRITFSHPLIRQAVYHEATISRRIQAHVALAEVMEDFGDNPGSVWHRTAAAAGADEGLAGDLDQLAEQAAARGGWRCAVAAHQRAAELSPRRSSRGRRLTAAATAAAYSGDMCRAAALADDALPMIDDVGAQARLAAVRADIEAERGSLRDAAWILLQGAGPVADADPARSATLLLTAARQAWASDYREAVALAAVNVKKLDRSAAVDICAAGVRGFAGVAENDAEGWRWFRRMVSMARTDRTGIAPMVQLRAIEAALLVGDDVSARDLGLRLVDSCRTQGRADLLPQALHLIAQAHLFLGTHPEALAAAEQAIEMSTATGAVRLAAQAKAVVSRIAAMEGDEARCQMLTTDPAGAGSRATYEWAAASWTLLDLGLGRAEIAACRVSEDGAGPFGPTIVRPEFLADMIEVWVRTDRHDQARLALAKLTAYTDHGGAAWAAAVALRCRALMNDDAAGDLYAEAVRWHGRGPGRPFERARTELLYGEWLRRHRRRTDAREQLRSALAGFEAAGAAPWADRARSELRAAGESWPRGNGSGSVLRALTTQELQVAQLAAAGLSNQDIAVRMSISPRTVGYHLYKAYPKLGVTKRMELARFDFANSG
ncbi:helix-turn-helix transcriptional regulator [Phytoactinopolyspora limicola]|uniref:helix-turn-helix transcriptional regulator n=1 Tax=Phytoactinopolyspora limicola TaxID=2715536 RepID=UPI00140A7DCD|nr:LuxR family transcriptional regulator [Phytoactinopolyspora limicola]